MLNLLVLALAFGQVDCLVARASRSTDNNAEKLFVKDGKDGSFKPYKSFDYKSWVPNTDLYNGIPMVEKTVMVKGEKLVYQDFNISALGEEDFKNHYMNLPEFHDAKGKFIPTNDQVKAYQFSLATFEEDADAKFALPGHLLSKRDWPSSCFDDQRQHCAPSCINHISRGVRQSVNDNVYGAYHYVSGAQCGSGSISKTVTVTHTSSVTLGGYAQIPGFGKGWTKVVSTFFSTFGFSPSKSPDSVSTGLTYAGTCGPFNVCFLWERPHFQVDKGVIVTHNVDIKTNKACSAPVVTPYESHIMHDDQDPGGAASHGICHSMGYHGCGSKVVPSKDLPRCPGNF
ncbi:hypothetical protein FZEAL_9034 [Fusarium zealandicum]|uniref:Uncharacterized protein n=1 Tax=Fusarium zealandicum TaxID=1053134 RepID=A0A8H4UD59_9HYPO|nr:hypothetical protein FZEAL_9034 [Fusarium zealandicum]